MLLVDNGSQNSTRQALEALQKEFPKVVMVPIDVNQGYGGGILQGLEVARGDFLGYLTGDNLFLALDIIAAQGFPKNPESVCGETFN